MRTLYIILLSFGCLGIARSQETEPQDKMSHDENVAHITGRVLDSVSHQPLQYATITLFHGKDTRPAGGGMTNRKGQFAIGGIVPGKYRVTIDIIGYASRTLGPLDLHGRLSLGDISVGKSASDLQAVTVTATKGLVENKIDKMVYNVEKDVTSLGGVATDVLKKVPMVSVDVDGNVDIMGNTNILS